MVQKNINIYFNFKSDIILFIIIHKFFYYIYRTIMISLIIYYKALYINIQNKIIKKMFYQIIFLIKLNITINL